MIKFEFGMLVLDNNTTKEDVDAVKEFADNVRKQENERIINLLKESDSVCNEWAIALIKGENK
jgi:CHASE3 domain sensor protein